MKISKDNLKIGIWYEDEEGNKIDCEDEVNPTLPDSVTTYHTRFPLQITETIYSYHSNKEKAECKHRRKCHKKDTGLIRGYKGRTCGACGCTQVRKWWQPWGKNWDTGTAITRLISFNTTIGGGNQDAIMAMVNSGDYTLQEALCVWATACERCLNVIAYKYLDGKDGYPLHSDEWKSCNTVCDFCRDEEN